MAHLRRILPALLPYISPISPLYLPYISCLSEEARSPFGPVYFLYARPLAVVCIAHLGMHAAVG